jgi:hypothetical protein
VWYEQSFNVKCQLESIGMILKVIIIFCLGRNCFDFFSSWRRNARLAIKYLFVSNTKYTPLERWWRITVILCELNYDLHSFSIYYKINLLPVRNFIVCSTWPTCKIKRLNKENDVSNFAIVITYKIYKCLFIH